MAAGYNAMNLVLGEWERGQSLGGAMGFLGAYVIGLRSGLRTADKGGRQGSHRRSTGFYGRRGMVLRCFRRPVSGTKGKARSGRVWGVCRWSAP